jgi:NADH dehydrogenase (ubiquinone) 1 beta subcomplex subunit 3
MIRGRERTSSHSIPLARRLTDLRREAWRYTGPFTRWNRFKGSFPGLGIASVAFAGYLVYEQMFLTSSHGHGDAHGEAHH